ADLDAAVVRQLDVRTYVELGGELQHLAVLELGDVQLGLAERLDLLLLQRLAVDVRQRVVDGTIQHGAAADALVHDLRRNLALAKARDRDLVADRLVRLVEAWLELVESDLDGELDPGRVQRLLGALHVDDSPSSDVTFV